ncbi:hypothetical protein A3Q56_04464, partial [Intoshia linei]
MIVLIFLTILVCGSPTEIDSNVFTKTANDIGEALKMKIEQVAPIEELRKKYHPVVTKVEKIDMEHAKLVLSRVVNEISKLIAKKKQVVNKLVNSTEMEYINHVDEKIDKSSPFYQYKNLHKLNSSNFDLVKRKKFFNLSVSIHQSTVHLPVTVYEKAQHILNIARWTSNLDKIFVINNKEKTTRWQYFCTTSGLYRIYPGIVWNTDQNILYNCRIEPWYNYAATFRKDLIILYDMSGSMTGRNLQMAKFILYKLMSTLTENDYFNVIVFNNIVKPIDRCYINKMMQATDINKERVTRMVNNVGNDVADFENALILAFEYLNKTKNCNKAIMILTDGIYRNYYEIYKKYNYPHKPIRVFVYGIGNAIRYKKQLQWMACSNRGYFSQISSISDIEEKIHLYTNIISRKIGLSNIQRNVITSSQSRIGKVLSISQPVYDRKNKTYGNLLGVIGTDLLITDLEAFYDIFSLSHDSYFFIIDNNGFVVSHPNFDSKKNQNNVIDLAELELEFGRNDTKPNYNMTLRNEMINGKSGILTFKVVKFFKEKEGYGMVNSLCIALAIPHEQLILNIKHIDENILNFKKKGFTKYVNQEYTKNLKWTFEYDMNTNVDQVLLNCQKDIYKNDIAKNPICNMAKLNRILFESNLLHSMYSNNFTSNITDLLIGYLQINQIRQYIKRDNTYQNLINDKIEKSFRNVIDGNNKINVNIKQHGTKYINHINGVIEYISTNNTSNIIGAYEIVFDDNLFKEILNQTECMKTVKVCKLNGNCINGMIYDCYIIDELSRIVYSHEPKDMAQPLSSVEYTIFEKLKESNIFNNFSYPDYQSICNVVEEKLYKLNKSFKIMNPFQVMKSVMYVTICNILNDTLINMLTGLLKAINRSLYDKCEKFTFLYSNL